MKYTRVNDFIRFPEIRVIGDDGEQLGVITPDEGRRLAKERGLDLVEVAPNAKPPVCKIMDYGKYKYQQMKEDRKQRKRAKKVEVKGVRISLRISQNDLEFKAKQADKFLQEGNKVRVELILRGRENAHRDLAKDIFKKFMETMEEDVIIEQQPKRQRLGLAIVIHRKTQ